MTDNLQVSSLLDLGNGHSLKILAEEARAENSTMRQITEKTFRDAVAVKILTIATLVYLPATVVSVSGHLKLLPIELTSVVELLLYAICQSGEQTRGYICALDGGVQLVDFCRCICSTYGNHSVHLVVLRSAAGIWTLSAMVHAVVTIS